MGRRLFIATFIGMSLFLAWMLCAALLGSVDAGPTGHPVDGSSIDVSINPSLHEPDRAGDERLNAPLEHHRDAGRGEDAWAEHQRHKAAEQQASAVPQIGAAASTDFIDPPLPRDRMGRTLLGWSALANTRFVESASNGERPAFPDSLRKVDGQTVILSGFMSPFDDVGQLSTFMLVEYPIGCFYCQVPGPTSIVMIELAEGHLTTLSYDAVKVTGTLRLNADDPEDFLYIVDNAAITAAD